MLNSTNKHNQTNSNYETTLLCTVCNVHIIIYNVDNIQFPVQLDFYGKIDILFQDVNRSLMLVGHIEKFQVIALNFSLDICFSLSQYLGHLEFLPLELNRDSVY